MQNFFQAIAQVFCFLLFRREQEYKFIFQIETKWRLMVVSIND